jgi:hypothetical protein
MMWMVTHCSSLRTFLEDQLTGGVKGAARLQSKVAASAWLVLLGAWSSPGAPLVDHAPAGGLHG